jgi:transcriptional regulator GlxA family with amidase domain
MSDKIMPISVSNAPRMLGFFLVDGFALMSYASIVEPFRAANVLADEELYRWVHVSVDGTPAHASNGAAILADARVGDPIACDTLFLFAAGDPSRFDDQASFGWLRRLARSNVRLVGVSGGPYLMVRAGVLDGYRMTIHWDHRAALADDFPTIVVDPGLYVIDRQRVTCAGGTAGLDLAIELIERDHGHALAARVGEWFIRTESRSAEDPQRVSLRDRYGVSNDRVLRALASMERHVEEPLGRESLAQIAGVSVRQLERLFSSALGTSVGAAYRRIRLEQAATLLVKTGMSVTEVAIACGFQSVSHFSRAFRAHYGSAPGQCRATIEN